MAPLKKKNQMSFEEQTQDPLTKQTANSEVSDIEDMVSAEPDENLAALQRKRLNKNIRQSIESLVEAHSKYINYQGSAAQKQAYMMQLYIKVHQYM